MGFEIRMMFEKHKLTVISLIFLAIAGFFILLDANNYSEDNLTLRLISENNRDFSHAAAVDNASSSSKGRHRSLSSAPTSDEDAKASIKSSYFENHSKVSSVSINTESIERQKSFSGKSKKAEENLGTSSSSSTIPTLSRRGSSVSGLICENVTSASSPITSSENENYKPPMKVGGDEDPGEPPVPVGDGLWILICAAFTYFAIYKLKK